MKKVIWGIDGGNFVQISRSYMEGVHILGQNIFSGSFLEVWRLRRVIFRHGEIEVARNWKVKRLHEEIKGVHLSSGPEFCT